MKHEDIEKLLGAIDPPEPDKITHHEDLKIPLLRYKRSSKVGLLLLILPAIVALTSILRRELGISVSFFKDMTRALAAIDGHPVLSIIIPLIAIGLPCTAMVINLLSFAHCDVAREQKEMLITLKYRPVNIAIVVLSFAILVFFFMPDALTF